VCTFDEQNVADPYHHRIRELARSIGIDVVPIQEFRTKLDHIIQVHQIQAALCISWRYLFQPQIVSALEGNVVVAHDALLPKYRGFAPLATAMIAGDSQTGVTFLRVGDKVDNGPILWQGAITIEATDTIKSLIQKLVPLYIRGVELFLEQELREGTQQDESQATYSIWRDEADYAIEWELDSERIERTIRALGPPYLGARTRSGTDTVVIHRASVQPDITFAIRQPGKIWHIDEKGRPTVVCGRGLLRIDEARRGNKNFLPVRKLRGRFG
jgi:methionyl-tRNA formyltransferase